MSEIKRWWQERPLIISAVQCSLGDTDEYVLDEYVSKYGFNAEQLLHLVAKGHMGYFDEKEHGEKLDRYLVKSRQYGIREIVYYNTHCINKDISAEHPDWLQLTKDNQTMPAYSIYNLVCVNPHGAWHKAFLKDLEDLCHHDVDGVFLDGPVMRDNGCYCDVCRADFLKKFGHPVEEATRLELQQMRVDSVTEHVKEAYETVKRINPDIALYLNNSALRADITGNNTRKVFDYVDILGAEGGFHTASLGSGLWSVSARAKHLEGVAGDQLADGKPVVCFFAGNLSGCAYYMHTAAETLLTYAQSYANGSNIWYGVHYSASEFKDTQPALTSRDMNSFILKNRDIFGASNTCARIALVWSQATANNYASSVYDSDFAAARKSGFKQRGDHYAALMSVFDMLTRKHIQFDIIDDTALTDGTLFKYESVILPEVACLSDAEAQAIMEFTALGGSVLGNYDCGMYNEDGSYAGKPKLAELFGLTGEPKIVGSPSVGTSYMYSRGTHALTEKLPKMRIPAPVLNIEWTASPDTNVIMENVHPMPSVYAHLDTDNFYPSVTEHKYGEGKAYYISGNYAETAAGVRNVKEYTTIIDAYCRETARPVVISSEPGLYEVVLRRQTDRFILHVINMTGAMERPIEEFVPLYNVKFNLNLTGFGIDRANFSLRALRGSNITGSFKDGMNISFSLDKLNDYEIVVIE